tara:strand:+ start:155 stop:529 length:375 start_codon:yes stop_codon:yes gene_type:complete
MITLMQVIQELRPGAQCRIIGDTYNDIIWDDTNYVMPTDEEIINKTAELKAAEPFTLLREERNRRLAECDWVVTKNAEYGNNIPKEWRAYRQALRDLPSITYKPELDEFGYLKMDSVAWPTPPE